MKYPNHYNQLNSILHLSPPSTKKIAKYFANHAFDPLLVTEVASTGQLG